MLLWVNGKVGHKTLAERPTGTKIKERQEDGIKTRFNMPWKSYKRMTVLKELRGVSREAEKHLKEKNGFLNSLKEVAVKEIPSEPVQNWPWSIQVKYIDSLGMKTKRDNCEKDLLLCWNQGCLPRVLGWANLEDWRCYPPTEDDVRKSGVGCIFNMFSLLLIHEMVSSKNLLCKTLRTFWQWQLDYLEEVTYDSYSCKLF